MNLLILTQKVDKNDSNLGFFHEWIKHFAEEVEKLTVICLQEGEYSLPDNVEVYSLGKEKGKNRLQILSTFYFLAFSLRHHYDAVFVHMNPEYVVLGGLLWRLWGKRIALWYTHKSVTLKLRVASWITHEIFTASRESFRLDGGKVHVVGHGIDVSQFECRKPHTRKVRKILTLGRISESKNLDTLIDATVLLQEEWYDDFKVYIVGDPITYADIEYLFLLKLLAGKQDIEKNVDFIGSIPHTDVPDAYTDADVFVNLSDTGSIDKAVLEAMASCVPVVSSNEAFEKILSEYDLFVDSYDPKAVAEAIKRASGFRKTRDLRSWVEKNHSLKNLIPHVISLYEKTSR